MLHLHENSVGGSTALHPTLIWDDEAAVLIDTGMPGSWERIRTAMLEAGVSPAILKAVILTHQDFDHIGSVPEIIAEAEQAKVYAHKLDQPYIEGTLPLIKTSPEAMAPLLEMLPEEERQKAIDFLAIRRRPRWTILLMTATNCPMAAGFASFTHRGIPMGTSAFISSKARRWLQAMP